MKPAHESRMKTIYEPQDSRNDRPVSRHILAANDMYLAEKRGNGPSCDLTDDTVDDVGVR